jgi:hypothetical protein
MGRQRSAIALLATAVVAAMTATSSVAAAGGGWHESYTSPYQPPSSAGNDPGLFTSVAALSPTSVLAAGATNVDYFSRGTPIIEQWDGHTWTAWDTSALPAAVQHDAISGIAARSLSDVWITAPEGDEGQPPVVAHWDGSAWSPVTSEGLPPNWSGTLLLLGNSTSIVGDDDAFIATYRDSATHPRWLLTRYARNGSFSDGIARTAHDAWAVGSFASDLNSGRSLIEHWNGTKWHRVKVRSKLYLLDVAAGSKSSVMALGAKNPINGARRALLWNGKRWRDVGSPKGKPYLDAVTPDPDGGYWTAGNGAGLGNHTTYYRYAHGRWTTVLGPVRKFPHTQHQDVSVTDLATAGHSVWAVGFHRGWDPGCGELCPDTIAGAPIVDRR